MVDQKLPLKMGKPLPLNKRHWCNHLGWGSACSGALMRQYQTESFAALLLSFFHFSVLLLHYFDNVLAVEKDLGGELYHRLFLWQLFSFPACRSSMCGSYNNSGVQIHAAYTRRGEGENALWSWGGLCVCNKRKGYHYDSILQLHKMLFSLMWTLVQHFTSDREGCSCGDAEVWTYYNDNSCRVHLNFVVKTIQCDTVENQLQIDISQFNQTIKQLYLIGCWYGSLWRAARTHLKVRSFWLQVNSYKQYMHNFTYTCSTVADHRRKFIATLRVSQYTVAPLHCL